ncbi:MAG TPA: hypothetical protein VJQ43_02420, partial [Thermoplasmata archaeon]|nr:hypothetical protein [Thermoplasmata archaeon]
VGYLSFHYYPAAGLCVVNGTYCAPGTGPGTGVPDANLFQPGASLANLNFYAPRQAAALWSNATGTRVPVLVTESNLNGAGGSPSTAAFGSDPRQQTLFAAAWLVSTLLNATSQNVSDFVYFTLTGVPPANGTVTGPIGGWGFGLTSEGSGDTDTRYAPYWAFSLYNAVAAPGSSPLAVQSDPTGVVGALASRAGSTIHVLLVNRAVLPVAVPLTVAGANTTLTSITVLDNRSYVEAPDPVSHVEQLYRSTVQTVADPGALLTLGGYAVVLVTLQVNLPTSGGGGGGGGGTGGGPPGGSPPGPVSKDPAPTLPDHATRPGHSLRGDLGTASPGSSGSIARGPGGLANVGAGLALTILAVFGSIGVWRGTPEPPAIQRPGTLAGGRRRSTPSPKGSLRYARGRPVKSR